MRAYFHKQTNAGTETSRYEDTHTKEQTDDRQSEKLATKHMAKRRDTETETQRGKRQENHRERDTDREKDREPAKQRDRETETKGLRVVGVKLNMVSHVIVVCFCSACICGDAKHTLRNAVRP